MTQPLVYNKDARQTLLSFIDTVNVAGETLNFHPTATDYRYQRQENGALDSCAELLTETVSKASGVIQLIDQLDALTQQTTSEISSEDAPSTPSASLPVGDTEDVPLDIENTGDAENPPTVEPAPRVQTTSLADIASSTAPFTSVSSSAPVSAPNTVNLSALEDSVFSDTGVEFTDETSLLSSPAAETNSNGGTHLSSAGETSLSSGGETTLSAGGGDGGNKYVGYSGGGGTMSAASAEYLHVPQSGVQMNKDALSALVNLPNNLSYGPEIFEEIVFEDGGYGGEYGDMYGGGDYSYAGGYSGGDGIVLVGEPTSQTALDVSQVTYERPYDMTLTPDELNACIDEVLWRAGIEDPVAQNKWRQTLLLIAEHESTNNPAAGNNWDSNAVGGTQVDGLPAQSSRGLMQTIPSTFAAYHMGGTSTSIYDPVASMGAATLYLMGRYNCDIYGNGLDAFYSARVPVYHGY